MDADVNKFEVSASLGVDLNDGEKDPNKTVEQEYRDDNGLKDTDDLLDKDGKPINYGKPIYVSSLGSGISVEGKFNVGALVELALTLGAGDMFPSIESNFKLDWGNKGNGKVTPALNYLGFDELKLNAGEFIDNMFGGVVNKVKKVIEPIQPLIDFLQSEIPVLNKLPAGAVHITVLDLIKKFGKGKMDFGFLDDIIQLNQIVKMLGKKHEGSDGITLDLPNLVLFESDNTYDDLAICS